MFIYLYKSKSKYKSVMLWYGYYSFIIHNIFVSLYKDSLYKGLSLINSTFYND